MGLFSSKSKSTQNTEIDNSIIENVDQRQLQGDNAIVGGNQSAFIGDGGGTVNQTVTDFGAVSAAISSNEKIAEGSFDFGRDSLDFAQDAFSESAAIAAGATSSAFDLTEDVIKNNQDNLEFALQQSAQQFDRSLAFAQNANTSENAKFLDTGANLLKGAGVLVGGLAAIYIFKRA